MDAMDTSQALGRLFVHGAPKISGRLSTSSDDLNSETVEAPWKRLSGGLAAKRFVTIDL